MFVLGIESSCDETAAAVIDESGKVLSDIIHSQITVHAPYGGVIPELASRDHIRNIGPVVQQALDGAGVSLSHLGAICVTHRPGLVGALLVGVQFAKGLAWSTGLPLIGVDHLVGHLHAAFLRRSPNSPTPPAYPFVALLASGGHTAIYRVLGPLARDMQELGATRDDAAGEAYDKVAKLLGLGYPGGPVIDRLAPKGDPTRVALTVPMANKKSLEMSFSGIKTQVASYIRAKGPLDDQSIADVCASFQSAVTEVLAQKLFAAARQEGVDTVVIGGGVAANSALRRRVTDRAAQLNLRAALPEIASCTDNAAMIAHAGLAKWRAGERDSWDMVATSATSLPRRTRKGRGDR